MFQNNLHFKVSSKMKEDPVWACGVIRNGKVTSLLETLQEHCHVFDDAVYFLKNKRQPGVEILFKNIWNVISIIFGIPLRRHFFTVPKTPFCV